MMRKYLKHISAFFLIPLTRWYLRKERKYTYDDITVTVWPGVFHPGLFYSTKFILDYLKHQPLASKTFLELGCGTGLISIFAARSKARVVASDLSPAAIGNTRVNAMRNNVSINVVMSDLFDELIPMKFEWIVINPPYYARAPKNQADLSWNCGEHFEYFKKLFSQLRNHITGTSQIIIVLTKGCDINTIVAIARENGFELHLIREKNVLFDEKDYLYKVGRAPAPSYS